MQAGTRAAAVLISLVLLAGGRVAGTETPFSETEIPVFLNDNASDLRYRLPSVLVTSKTTLVAVAQLRRGRSDFTPQDPVCRRSTDGGRSWGSIIIVRHNPNQPVCLFNGCVVEDIVAGKLLASRRRASWRRPAGGFM